MASNNLYSEHILFDHDYHFVNSPLFKHIQHLLNIESVTPDDNGCQAYLAAQLADLGFHCHRFSKNGVSNLIATIGTGATHIAFAGHTDVVPTGCLSQWRHQPFGATIEQGYVYGRGIADMKGGIAAMLSAIAKVKNNLLLERYRFSFLITSDEEGEAEFGTKEIVNYLAADNNLPSICIVGEPSASEVTGDVIKVGRRGAISGEISIRGKQGHVAYPQFANNAAHGAAQLATLLTSIEWQQGSDDFPGTSLQITAIDTGEWTDNIIPGSSRVCFNVRYSHHYQQADIEALVKEKISNIAQQNFIITLDWLRPCLPYYTEKVEQSATQCSLITAAEQAIYHHCHRFPRLSTSGGTSDGRFIASPQCQVIELGVPNKTIHQINERVAINDLQTLEKIYQQLLVNLMGQ